MYFKVKEKQKVITKFDYNADNPDPQKSFSDQRM